MRWWSTIMSRKNLNLYGGDLGESEGLEMRQNIEENFGDLYGEGRNYADELTAAKAGVGFGQLYHTNGAVKVRYSLLPIPAVGGLALQTYAPVIRHTMVRAPTVGSLAFTGAAPVVTQQLNRTPASGSLGLTGAAPVLS
jgi:hypothetical protein